MLTSNLIDIVFIGKNNKVDLSNWNKVFFNPFYVPKEFDVGFGLCDFKKGSTV